MLTSRMKQSIKIILASEDYITLATIAQNMSVSTRTLLRELDDVEKWVGLHSGALDKKKGKGLRILGTIEERRNMLLALDEEKSELIFTPPSDRYSIIRATMLNQSEPIKLYSLSCLMDVTESTIANDLVHLEEWFDTYDIQVVRKPGLGILLSGHEKSFRRAIVALIYEQIQLSEIMDFVGGIPRQVDNKKDIKGRISKAIYKLMDMASINDIRLLLKHIEQEMGYQFADNAFVTLVIRYSVTRHRKEQWGGQQLISYTYRDTIKYEKIHKIILRFIEDSDNNSLAILPEEELLYLTMHIKGAKLRDTESDNKISMIEDFRTIQLVKEFVTAIESETGIYLVDNEQLMVGLVKHLRPAYIG